MGGERLRRKSVQDAMRRKQRVEVRDLASKKFISRYPYVIRRRERSLPSINETTIHTIVDLKIRVGAVITICPEVSVIPHIRWEIPSSDSVENGRVFEQ